MTRGRTYLLIAAVGVIAGVAAGVLNGAGRDRPLSEFSWGSDLLLGGSNIVANRIRVFAPFDDGSRRFGYYTGGHSVGSGEPSNAPSRVIAEGVHGAVTVRLRAFDPYTRESAADDAAEIARVVSLATTHVWPRQPMPVEVDLYFMPEDVPFSLAKRVDWQEGAPYVLAIFARPTTFASGTAAHELYHVLAGRRSLGTQGRAARARPNAASAYEEAAADLFAACGRLLANGSLSRDPRTVTVTIGDRRFEDILEAEELASALDLLSRDAPGSKLLRDLLARTVLADVFGDDDTIALESTRGERLIARCRESASNPMLLEFRLAELLAAREAEPEQPAVGR